MSTDNTETSTAHDSQQANATEEPAIALTTTPSLSTTAPTSTTAPNAPPLTAQSTPTATSGVSFPSHHLEDIALQDPDNPDKRYEDPEDIVAAGQDVESHLGSPHEFKIYGSL